MQTTKTRIISIITAFALLITVTAIADVNPFPHKTSAAVTSLTVGGTTHTTGLSGTLSDNGWSWDGAINFLTIDGDYSGEPIEFIGDNATDTITIDIQPNADVTVSGGSQPAISANCNLNINIGGDSTLNIISDTDGISANGVTVNGNGKIGTITAGGDGISASGDITINTDIDEINAGRHGIFTSGNPSTITVAVGATIGAINAGLITAPASQGAGIYAYTNPTSPSGSNNGGNIVINGMVYNIAAPRGLLASRGVTINGYVMANTTERVLKTDTNPHFTVNGNATLSGISDGDITINTGGSITVPYGKILKMDYMPRELRNYGEIWLYPESSFDYSISPSLNPSNVGTILDYSAANISNWYSPTYEYNPATSFEISTAAELAGFAWVANNIENFEGKTVTLKNHIDLEPLFGENKDWNSGYGWIPIGESDDVPFKGMFNGGSKIISGLYADNANNSYYALGLFGDVRDGVIKNVFLSEPVILDTMNNGRTGGIAGRIHADNSGSIIERCTVIGGTIKGGDSVGGIVGYLDKSTIGNYSFVVDCEIEGGTYVGGIAGSGGNANSVTERCAVIGGTVKSNGDYAGGLFGSFSGAGSDNNPDIIPKIKNSYTTCDVNGVNNVGGLIGYSDYKFIMEYCYAAGNISGVNSVGGLNGSLNSYGGEYNVEISNCAAINPLVTASGSNAGKISTTSSIDVFSKIYALDVMTGGNSSNIFNGYNGDDRSDNTFLTPTFWSENPVGTRWENAPWDGENIWTLEDGKYPHFGPYTLFQSGFEIVDPGEKTYDDPDFTLTTVGGEGNGAVTFSVENNNVIDVSADGEVTIKNAGGPIIVTARKAASGLFSQATATINIIVNRKPIPLPTPIQPLTYNGEEQIGVATGTDFSITDNTAVNAGTHTATATPGDNFQWESGANPTQPRNIPFTIAKANGASVNAPAEATKMSHSITVTSSLLPNTPISDQTIQYAKSNTNTAPTADSEWQDSGEFTALDEYTEYYFFARSKENNNFKEGTPSAGTLIRTSDGTPPIGEILIRTNSFKTFLNTITFGLFFKDTIDITITANDEYSDIKSVEYLLSEIDLTEIADWTVFDWITGNPTGATVTTVNANWKGIVYARIADNSGNVTFINSDGVVVYTDSETPVDGGTFYKGSDSDYEIPIEMNGNTVKSVELGGLTLPATNYVADVDKITFTNSYLRSLSDGVKDFTVSYYPLGETATPQTGGDIPAVTVVTLTVAKSDQAPLTVTGLEMSYTYGDSPVTAGVSGGSGTGAVTYSSSNTEVASVSGNTVTILKAGTFTVTAHKDGDDYYNPIESPPFTVTVVEATPDIELKAEKSGVNVLLTATVSKAGANILPEGEVTFYKDNEILGKVPLHYIDGASLYEVIAPGVGDFEYKAVYGGMPGYYTSATDTTTYNTDKEDQTGFSINDPGAKTYGDSDFTLTATGGQSGGNVTFSVPANDVIDVTSSGTVTIKNAGTVTVTAIRAGNSVYNDATATATVTVNPRDIEKVTVNVTGSRVYTGSQLTPDFDVDDGSITITSNDYTVSSYGENITVADGGSITLTGQNNYTGTKTVQFAIHPAPITAAAITVTAPTMGAIPNTAATAAADANFSTGAVVWSPNNNPFLPEIQYTATVTLTADSNYIFVTSGLTASVNGQTAEIENNTGETVTISYQFAPTGAKAINGISVKTQPKLTYIHNEQLDLSALEITVSYNDGTSDDVVFADFTEWNISASPTDLTTMTRAVHNGTTVEASLGEFTANTEPLNIGKAQGALADAPVLVGTPTKDTITVSAVIPINPGNQEIQYAKNTTNTAPTSDSDWQDSGTFTDLDEYTEYFFFARAKENNDYDAGAASAGTNISTADETAPTGEIKIKTNAFSAFINTVSFGLFYKNTIDITVTGNDVHSGVKTVEYHLSSDPDSKSMTDWSEIEWTEGNSANVTANWKGMVYARITDNYGNETVISSDGFVVYTDSAGTPEIEYVKGSGESKDANVTLNGNTISKIMNGEDSLTFGTHYTVSGGTITFTPTYLETLSVGNNTLTVYYNPMGETYVSGDLPNTTNISVTVTEKIPDVTTTTQTQDTAPPPATETTSPPTTTPAKTETTSTPTTAVTTASANNATPTSIPVGTPTSSDTNPRTGNDIRLWICLFAVAALATGVTGVMGRRGKSAAGKNK